MDYKSVSIGRVFLVRVEHGEDFLEKLKELAREENISFGTVTFLGALTSADIVAGPKKLELPAQPTDLSFSDGREVVGFGTISRKSGEVTLHVHASLGKGEKTLAGCLRKNCEVFITVEAIVTELVGADVLRKKDSRTGHELLFF